MRVVVNIRAGLVLGFLCTLLLATINASTMMQPDGLMNVEVALTVTAEGAPSTPVNNAEWLGIWTALDGGASTPGVVGSFYVSSYHKDTEAFFDYGEPASLGFFPGGGENYTDISTINNDGPNGYGVVGGGPSDSGDRFSVRAVAYLLFTTGGTYTIAMASDDGRRLELTKAGAGLAPGYKGFNARYGNKVNDPAIFNVGDTVIGWSGNTFLSSSLGQFDVTAGDILKLDAFYYENRDVHSGEIAIAAGAKSEFDNQEFDLLANNVAGIKMATTLAPLLPPPTEVPTAVPSTDPSAGPSGIPSDSPSSLPSNIPSSFPSSRPSGAPSNSPSDAPSAGPSGVPSGSPTSQPSRIPSVSPSAGPSGVPSGSPTSQPSRIPSGSPSAGPSRIPSRSPTSQPSRIPSVSPSDVPSVSPSSQPSRIPSADPSFRPSRIPSSNPSSEPSHIPSSRPSDTPSADPSAGPSGIPSVSPTYQPSSAPSSTPSYSPSLLPSALPSNSPSLSPSTVPSISPSKEDPLRLIGEACKSIANATSVQAPDAGDAGATLRSTSPQNTKATKSPKAAKSSSESSSSSGRGGSKCDKIIKYLQNEKFYKALKDIDKRIKDLQCNDQNAPEFNPSFIDACSFLQRARDLTITFMTEAEQTKYLRKGATGDIFE